MTSSDKHLTIVFIINGEDVQVEAELDAPLQAARNQALTTSHNTGRPPEDWEVRTIEGLLLPPEGKIRSFNFAEGVRLFLTLKTGAGGT